MVKKLSSQERHEILDEITSLADGLTLEYVKELSAIVRDPDSDKKRKA